MKIMEKVNMVVIILEVEVMVVIEQVFVEDFDDMEELVIEEILSEFKIEIMRCFFELINKYVSDVEDMNEYVLLYFELLNYVSWRIIIEQCEVMVE